MLFEIEYAENVAHSFEELGEHGPCYYLEHSEEARNFVGADLPGPVAVDCSEEVQDDGVNVDYLETLICSSGIKVSFEISTSRVKNYLKKIKDSEKNKRQK